MLLKDVLFRGQTDSFASEVSEIEGALPAHLDGVLFRNGAGTLQVGADPVAFLDGHSLLGALEVADGRAFFRATHPDTDLRREELAAGRMTRRRVFTNFPGWRKNFLNLKIGNGSAHDSYVWGGRVHATDLGAHYALSTPELRTEGKTAWTSVLERGELIAPMPRDDVSRNTLVAYALERSGAGERLRFVEVDESFGRVARSEPVALEGFVHDCAFSDRWYIAVQSSASPRLLPVLLGSQPIWWSFGWRDEAPTLILVPRGRSGPAVKLPLPTSLRTVFHILNAYDDGDEVVIDAVGYEGPVHFDFLMPAARDKDPRRVPENRLFRLRARPEAGSVEARPFDGASGEAPEVAPALHGKRYSKAWFASLPSHGAEDPNAYVLARAIGALDVNSGALSSWDAGEGHQLSPPAFAPDRSSDDPEKGWILAWDLDLQAETTDVVVLASDDIAAGPIARLKLGVYLPAVSHVRFAPGVRVRA